MYAPKSICHVSSRVGGVRVEALLLGNLQVRNLGFRTPAPRLLVHLRLCHADSLTPLLPKRLCQPRSAKDRANSTVSKPWKLDRVANLPM
eukprot:s608_g12.t1